MKSRTHTTLRKPVRAIMGGQRSKRVNRVAIANACSAVGVAGIHSGLPLTVIRQRLGALPRTTIQRIAARIQD